mmetsp:Transcript_568/g.2228  ORF Transcript_568/g.2228 Transcript_568/m.2228 type:complete len:407 (+) Transcript_568:1279-2499(+)
MFSRAEFSMWYSQIVRATRRELLLTPLAGIYAETTASWEDSVAHALLRPSFWDARLVCAIFDACDGAASLSLAGALLPTAVRVRHISFVARLDADDDRAAFWTARTRAATVVTRDAAAPRLPTPDEGAWPLHAPGLWALSFVAAREDLLAATDAELAALALLADSAFRRRNNNLAAPGSSPALLREGEPVAAALPLLWRWAAAALAGTSNTSTGAARLAASLRAQLALLRAVHATTTCDADSSCAAAEPPDGGGRVGAREALRRVAVEGWDEQPKGTTALTQEELDVLRPFWEPRAHGAASSRRSTRAPPRSKTAPPPCSRARGPTTTRGSLARRAAASTAVGWCPTRAQSSRSPRTAPPAKGAGARRSARGRGGPRSATTGPPSTSNSSSSTRPHRCPSLGFCYE